MTSGAGYSGTPLLKKLGFKSGSLVFLRAAPDHYAQMLDAGADIQFTEEADRAADAAHIFLYGSEDIAAEAKSAIQMLREGGMLWVSWAKKTSKLHAGVTEDDMRAAILPLGWVDVKVCAVDQDWSGLKFLKRKT